MKALKAALLFLSMMLFIAGCTSSNKFLSGTHLALGAYIPGTEGELYGVEIVNYLNGCMVRSSSN